MKISFFSQFYRSKSATLEISYDMKNGFLVRRREIELGRGPNMGRFHPSCVRLVYFLRKSTEFHVNRTECQRILFHFLLLIFSYFL